MDRSSLLSILVYTRPYGTEHFEHSNLSYSKVWKSVSANLGVGIILRQFMFFSEGI